MWKKILTAGLALVVFLSILSPEASYAFSGRTLRRGSSGDDVVELQARLQNIGYYHGKIDGRFGWNTYWALQKFQKNFGMPVVGKANDQTRNMLVKASNYNAKWVHAQIRTGRTFTYYQGVPLSKQVLPVKTNSSAKKKTAKKTSKKKKRKATKRRKVVKKKKTKRKKSTAKKKSTKKKSAKKKSASKKKNTKKKITKKKTAIPARYSENEIKLLSNAVYGEARGEPYEGQVAVAAVILNRINSSQFPNTVASVIFQPRAFTAVDDGQIYLTPNATARRAVIDAINGWDPSENALYYFNPAKATNQWIWGRPQIKTIGRHIFCK